MVDSDSIKLYMFIVADDVIKASYFTGYNVGASLQL